MARFRPHGLILICALAQLLAAPALGIILQDDAELAEFHNHALASLPSLQRLEADPVGYVQRARTWLTERIFPVQLATRVQKEVLFRWLREPPEPRVTLGEDGHIFLNGGSNQTLYGLFVNGCVTAHSDKAARALEEALQYWSGVASGRAITAIDFVVIPTAATLYADKLPASVPGSLRSACVERMTGRSALSSVRSTQHFVYPMREMLAAKSDAGFYPKGNWHAAGKSLQVVRDAYLAKVGVRHVVREHVRSGFGPAEILFSYGIDWERPRYFVENPAVSISSDQNAVVRDILAPLFRGDRFITHAYQNAQPVLDKHVLLLTDSFGDLAADVFAGAFRSLIQVNVNDLQGGSPSQVIDRVRRVAPVERVIFLIQEGNTQLLAQWR